MSAFPSAIFRYRSMPNVASNVPVTMTESRSLITIARATDAQRWEIELDGFVLRENSKQFQSFLMSLNGQLGIFTYSLPVYGESQATNKTVSTNAVRGSSSVSVASSAGVVAGDMLTFGNHLKVYQVTDVTPTSISVFPKLRIAVPSTTAINFENPVFTVRLRDNYQQFTASNRKSPDNYSISMIEVL